MRLYSLSRRLHENRAQYYVALRSGFALSGDSIVVSRSTRLEGGTNAFEFEEWARSGINAPAAIAIMPG